MLHWQWRQPRQRLHARAKVTLSSFVWVATIIFPNSTPLQAAAGRENPAALSNSLWSGFAIGFLLLIVVAVLGRIRLTDARRELKKTKELADYREYERNLAQQELV